MSVLMELRLSFKCRNYKEKSLGIKTITQCEMRLYKLQDLLEMGVS